MPEDTHSWYQKKRIILPALLLFPPLGIALTWTSTWSKATKITLSTVFGLLTLAALQNSPEAANNPPKTNQVSTAESVESQLSSDVQAVSTSESSSTADSIVRPEHQGKPIYIIDSSRKRYVVLTEPVGSLGQLQMTVVESDTKELVPVVTNCVDFKQKGESADAQLGEIVIPGTTLGDLSSWIIESVKTFCGDWNSSTVAAVAPVSIPGPNLAEVLPETPAVLISQTLGSKINIRTGPSTTASAPAYGFAGDSVILLAQAKDEKDVTWYQVRFEVSRHVGWVRADFVAIGPSPQPSPMPASRPVAIRPIREPVMGSCDCPYDLMSNGRRCGKRSAYSRPGGAAPVCYTNDEFSP